MSAAHRIPYVGEGADGARRSAEIDRTEAEGYDRHDPRVAERLESAARWEAQADQLDLDQATPCPITGSSAEPCGRPTDRTIVSAGPPGPARLVRSCDRHDWTGVDVFIDGEAPRITKPTAQPVDSIVLVGRGVEGTYVELEHLTPDYDLDRRVAFWTGATGRLVTAPYSDVHAARRTTTYTRLAAAQAEAERSK